MTFNILSWYGHLTVKDGAKLTKVVNGASKIIEKKPPKQQTKLPDLYIRAVERKIIQILSTSDHPLRPAFQLLPSGRRLKVPLARKKLV